MCSKLEGLQVMGKFQHCLLDGIWELLLILWGLIMVSWDGFYKSLSAVDGKCFSEKSVRSRFPHLCMDASPIPVSLGVTRGPNYLSRIYPNPTWIKYKANPENMVKLTSCSMGEGCTREEKDYFLMWVSLLQPSRSVFCAEALWWNNTWVRGVGEGEPYI